MEDCKVDLDILTAPMPKEAVKQRVIGGGMKADYVDLATVVRRLNRATGNNWSNTIDKVWMEGNKSLALVTITIPGLGSRSHIGVQAVDAKAGEDAVAKGAISDAIKKAATLFGVALDLYGEDTENPPYNRDRFDADCKKLNVNPGETWRGIRDKFAPKGAPMTEQQMWELMESKLEEYVSATGAGGKQDADTSDAG